MKVVSAVVGQRAEQRIDVQHVAGSCARGHVRSDRVADQGEVDVERRVRVELQVGRIAGRGVARDDRVLNRQRLVCKVVRHKHSAAVCAAAVSGNRAVAKRQLADIHVDSAALS